MFCRRAVAPLASLRAYSTATPGKPPVKLVAELRKLTEVSISKAREALSASNNDVQAAHQWLQNDLVASGAKKAAKLGDRATNQGLIGVSVLANAQGEGKLGRGVRAAMVEVNCETDFVGRNARFDALVADIAHTAAFIAEAGDSPSFMKSIPLDLLRDAPLLSHTGVQTDAQTTVGSAIHNSIARFGERIQLRRALSVVHTPSVPEICLRLATYAHGGVGLSTQGQIATLAVLALRSQHTKTLLESQPFMDELAKVERSLARQIVGFPVTILQSTTPGVLDESSLYEQSFVTYPQSKAQRVREVLRNWVATHRPKGLPEESDHALQVIEFGKWTVGEPI